MITRNAIKKFLSYTGLIPTGIFVGFMVYDHLTGDLWRGWDKGDVLLLGTLSLAVAFSESFIDTDEEVKQKREWEKIHKVAEQYRIERKKNDEIRQLNRMEEEAEQRKEQYFTEYQKLRKEIEAMPQYEIWRQAVFKACGRKCSICTSTEKLEIDHRYKSFHDIIRNNNITNVVQAYECAELWDERNGAPLCKECHDRTESSVYRQQKIGTQIDV